MMGAFRIIFALLLLCSPAAGQTIGQAGASGSGGGGPVTVSDGADVTQGAIGDAAASVGGIGTVSAKLRETTTLLNSVITAINTSAITGYATNGCAGATIANTANKPFSNAGSATALLLVSGVSSQKVHVCGVNIGPVAGAVNVAMVEGTTVSTACDTGTAGMMGGATAATGWQFAANGGLTNGNGMGQVAITATNADNVCLLFSAGVQVSGVITYAIF